MKKIFISFLIAVAPNVYAANIQYCPQEISCKIPEGSCTGLMGNGWFMSGSVASGGNFLPGTYKFEFSFATSSNDAAINCNYVAQSKDTTSKLIITQSTMTLKAATDYPSEWKYNDNGSYSYYYCYAPGLFYSKVNDARGCPFTNR